MGINLTGGSMANQWDEIENTCIGEDYFNQLHEAQLDKDEEEEHYEYEMYIVDLKAEADQHKYLK
jgi:hypothetical protein